MKISTLYALSLCKAMVTVAALAIAPTSAVAGEYSHEVIELPSAQPVCHIKKNGEFLAEIPPCFSVSGVDVPGGHWLVIAKLWFDLEAEDYTGVYVFDEVSRSMTDSIFAITYDGIIQDGETTVVMTSHQKHVVWDPLLNEGAYMPRAHALRGGKFTEIDPTPYADWTYLAVDTAWYISWLFAHSFTCTSSDLNPRFYNCQSYILSTRQLREIFTYIDRREPAEHVGGSDVVVAHSGDLTKTKAYIDALNKYIKKILGGQLDKRPNQWLYRQRHYSEAELFTHALRQHTDALYKDTGLSWLYKQGRYHVMEGMDLLWSSPVQASAGALGIVEAPGDRLLFILGRSSPRPQPDDITVWTYDKKKRAVTDTFSLTSILQIAHDGKNLILTEGWNQARFEAPYAPLRPRPHIYNKGRWTQGSKKYTEKYEYYQLNSYYHNRFIARLFLECRDDIFNCSQKDDFVKMLKELKELGDWFDGHKDNISLLDSSNTKVIPAEPQ